MSAFFFDPPPTVAVPIVGRVEKFPIHRIFCVGPNYEEHAKEMGIELDRTAPFWFTKAASCYVPSGTTVRYPPGTQNYQHEIEFVAAIGKAGFRIERPDALTHVFGYACGLDMSRRDLHLQARELRRPWAFGKDFEQAAVLSDIVPASICGHPTSGRIVLRVNGVTRQSSDLSLLIHPVAALIAHLSQFYHLEAGDIIYSGTPEGVEAVVPGDRIEGEIDGVSSIALTVGTAE